MIKIENNNSMLDFDVTADDFLRCLNPKFPSLRSKHIEYSYKKFLNIKENIGIYLEPDNLIYYPDLCANLRKLNKIDYNVSLRLEKFRTINEKGLASIIQSLIHIQKELEIDREIKAKLDAQIYNFIYLYGQNKQPPILHSIKPYFHRFYTAYCNNRIKTTNRFILNISNQKFYLNNQRGRFKDLSRLYNIESYQLLKKYFDKTKDEDIAIKQFQKTNFIGGILNTPIYIPCKQQL